jgi:hypothetical protein
LQHYKPRTEDRTRVMLRARLRDGGQERDACIVDLTSRGLAATADNPPRRDDFVEIIVGDIVVVGQVKWTSMRRFGMAFRERISVVGLLSGERGTISLQAREANRKRKARFALPESLGRRIEFAMLFAAGASAIFVLADFVGDVLRPIDQVYSVLVASNGG